MAQTQYTPREGGAWHVVQVGAGNIGGSLTGLLAHTAGLGKLTIVDHDTYESKNTLNQDITPTCVGEAKAEAMARRARQIRPELDVVAIVARVEEVPLGKLRGDVMLTCVDSRQSRRGSSEIAWHLGMPLVDAGVNAHDGLLARVSLFVPDPDGPCLQCGWDQQDYANLEQSHPCDARAPEAPATNAPLCLGSLAASLQALECMKLLNGEKESVLKGRQVLVDAKGHRHLMTAFRRNQRCRFDHQVWDIHRLDSRPGETGVARVLDVGAKGMGGRGPVSLGVEGRAFVRELLCGSCGAGQSLVRLAGRLSVAEMRCPECGEQMAPVGFSMRRQLGTDEPGLTGHTLAELGVLGGDILRLETGDGHHAHIEIDCDRM
jgi:molybdopterin-synthase adenylyltransferase